MSETNSSRMREVNDAWMKVGEAVNRATDLYLKELAEYLNWSRNVQREIFEQNIVVAGQFMRVGERQLAFFARMRENMPAIGAVPKGTETVVGMVDAVVRESGRAE
jgi:hypothetical protein